MIIKEVRDQDELRGTVEAGLLPLAQNVIENMNQDHFAYMFQVLAVLVSCSKQCTDFYKACLSMLLSGEAIFTKDNKPSIPAFGSFIRAMIRKYPQEFKQGQNQEGLLLLQALLQRINKMQQACFFESVSYPLFLDAVENLGVPDDTIREFLQFLMQAIQHYKNQSEKKRTSNAGDRSALVPPVCLRATHQFLSSFIVIKGLDAFKSLFEGIQQGLTEMLFSNYSQNIFHLQNSGRDSRYAVYGYI